MKKSFLLFSLFSFIFALGITFGYSSEDTSNANYLADQGVITQQTIASKYRLDDKILRQEVIAMALKVKGIAIPTNTSCKKYFADATKNDWVCRAVELAADNGIITKSNKNANPGKYVTRAEALIMMMKAGGITIDIFNQDYFNTNFHGLSDVYWTDSYKFSSTWMRDVFFSYMKYVNIDVPGQGQKRISDSGSSSFNYRIDSYATRAEVFAFAKNILNVQSGAERYCELDGMRVKQPCRIEHGIGGEILEYGDSIGLNQGSECSIYYIEGKDENGVSNPIRFVPIGLPKYQKIGSMDSITLSLGETQGPTILLGNNGYYNLFAAGNIDVCSGIILPDVRKLKNSDVLALYYKNLDGIWGDGNSAVDFAFQMRSPAGVSLATFESWYKNTDSVTFREDTLKDLGNNTYEFLVDMTENGKKSTFKVKSKVNLEKFTIDNVSSVKQ